MSNKLKELTKQAHHNAERQTFAKVLLSGKITPELYHYYLYNQFHIYEILESKLEIEEIKSVFRHERIREDIKELENLFGLHNSRPLTESTKKYIRYIQSIEDQSRLLAHVYVRHFGDMYGGQIIKKQIPGSGKMYEFENPEELKTLIRAMLNDDMAAEAIICFNFATELFKELIIE